jgi:hypothetical protein
LPQETAKLKTPIFNRFWFDVSQSAVALTPSDFDLSQIVATVTK